MGPKKARVLHKYSFLLLDHEEVVRSSTKDLSENNEMVCTASDKERKTEMKREEKSERGKESERNLSLSMERGRKEKKTQSSRSCPENTGPW